MEKGFDTQRLFIDPIVLPVKVPNAQVQHMTVGLSNLSQGTNERSLINRVFLAMAMSRGLDSAIADVFDEDLMNIVATSEMLMNKQIYSDSFLKVYAGSS
jgi:5-methyltetrahydrofolate corrinoid/iron sulfur protein methyltransferase